MRVEIATFPYKAPVERIIIFTANVMTNINEY